MDEPVTPSPTDMVVHAHNRINIRDELAESKRALQRARTNSYRAKEKIEFPSDINGQIWLRLPADTPKEFEAFSIYRDLGQDRSVAKAEVIYRERQGLPALDPDKKRRSNPVALWSSKYRWVERAAAYDAWLDAKAVTAAKRRRIQRAEKHADDQEAVQDVLMHPVRVAQQKLADVLAGRTEDDLEKLSVKELVGLVRQMAAILPDSQKSERDALTVRTDGQDVDTSSALKVKGEALKALFAKGRDAIGYVEAIQFEAQSDAAEG